MPASTLSPPATAATTPRSRVNPRLALACKVVLFLLATYHLLTGVVAVFMPDMSRPFYEMLYHFKPHFWEQYILILKPWGAYALFTGAALSFAFWDPRRYRGVIWCMTALLLVRVGYRLLFWEEAWRVFQIDAARNFLNAGLMVIWATVLGAWSVADWRASRGEPRTCEDAPA